MKILKKIIDRLGIGVIKPDRSSFWFVFNIYIIIEKGSDLIASCFGFTFISGPLLLVLQILNLIKLPNEGTAFLCVLILSIVIGNYLLYIF